MHFLLTNDDGIHADGLATLAALARRHGNVTVVAPHVTLSGCSHQVTDKQPLRLDEVEADRFMLGGTPADCARVGLRHLGVEAHWVLSGINHGSNLGTDVHMSGTVAAAREAALLGRPAIAFSQYHRPGEPLDWEFSATMAARVLAALLERPGADAPGSFWNVNFPAEGNPDSAEIVFCPLDVEPMPVAFEHRDGHLHYTGDYHRRPRRPGTDVDCCFAGKIAVTRLVTVHGVEP
jgi:5'-nucleotidase